MYKLFERFIASPSDGARVYYARPAATVLYKHGLKAGGRLSGDYFGVPASQSPNVVNFVCARATPGATQSFAGSPISDGVVNTFLYGRDVGVRVQPFFAAGVNYVFQSEKKKTTQKFAYFPQT